MRIAAFDSGIGGLTAIAPLFHSHDFLDVTFFGDRANLPYGTKSPDIIKKLAVKNAEWIFKNEGVEESFDLFIVACNTASAHALNEIKEIAAKYNVPVVGVIEPGCHAALKTISTRIVVLATGATVSCEAYKKELLLHGCKTPIEQKACPLFVPFVEEGILEGPALEWLCHEYLDAVLKPKDTVILGCTHYPFLLPTLSRIFPDQTWVDAGASLLEDPTVRNVMGKKSKELTKKKNLKLILTDDTISTMQMKMTLDFLGLTSFLKGVELINV